MKGNIANVDLALLGMWCKSKGEFGGGSWNWGRLPAAGLREEKLCVAVSMLISDPGSWDILTADAPRQRIFPLARLAMRLGG